MSWDCSNASQFVLFQKCSNNRDELPYSRDRWRRGTRERDHFLEFTIVDSGKWLVMMSSTSHIDSTVFGFGLGHEFSLVEQKKKGILWGCIRHNLMRKYLNDEFACEKKLGCWHHDGDGDWILTSIIRTPYASLLQLGFSVTLPTSVATSFNCLFCLALIERRRQVANPLGLHARNWRRHCHCHCQRKLSKRLLEEGKGQASWTETSVVLH